MKKSNFLFALFFMAFVCACQPVNPQPVFTPSADATVTALPLAATPPKISIHLSGRIQSFAVSPDHATIAIGTTNGILLYDFKTLVFMHSVTQDHSFVTSLAWSPDGKKLAAGATAILASDSGKTHLLVWDTSTWKMIFDPDLGDMLGNETIPVIAWSPDNRSLAASIPMNSVLVLDTQTGKTLSNQQEFAGIVRDLSWSPDGTRLVATGDLAYCIRRWKVSTGESVRLFDKRAGGSMQVAWSPDGQRIASGHGGGQVCLWTAATNRCDGFILAQQDVVYSLAWSPDGASLATGNSVIRIWDTQTGKLLSAFGEDAKGVYSHIEWPALGVPLVTLQIVFSSQDDLTIRFWDVPTGRVLTEFVGLGDGE